MQELSFSSKQERPNLGDNPKERSEQIHFGSITLSDIHGLNILTNSHMHKLNQDLPTLLLDDKLTNNSNLDHHIVNAGETLSAIAAEHLGTSSAQEIYNYVNQIGELNHIDQLDQISSGDFLVFPDLHLTNDSIFHQAPHKPHVALAHLLQTAAAHLPNEQHLQHDQQQQLGPVTAVSTAASETGTASAELPEANPPGKVEESTIGGFLSGVGNVVSEIADHCVQEITEHPGQFVQEVASAVVIGTAAVLLAPEVAAAMGTAGIVITGAELLSAVGAFGAASTITEVALNIGDWYEAAVVIANPEEHNGIEVVLAQNEMAEVGHFVVEQAQGFLGGLHTPHITPHSGSRKGFEQEEQEEEKEEEKKQMTKAA